jgi:hypothetical protein
MKLIANSFVRAFLCILISTIISFPGSVIAARYHVQVSGTLDSGPSLPDNWLANNCYASLSAAANSAAPGDTILLFRQTHHLDSSISLPTFLGNMDLSTSWLDVSIVCSPEAQMVVPSEHQVFTARGLMITSDRNESHLAAFLLEGDFAPTSHIFFENCFFDENRGSDLNLVGGSCIAAPGSGNGSLLEISSCLFTNNINRGIGGAIFINNGYEVEIQNSDFQNNDSIPGVSQAEGRGGAIAVFSSTIQSRLYITDTRFEGNRAWGPGGTIYIDDGSLTLLDSELNRSESAMEFLSNWAAGAGILLRRTEGAHLDDSFMTVERCLFDGNIGHLDANPWAGDGGAILVKGIDDRYVDVNVTDCIFQNNYNAQGAGLYVGRFANGNVTRCRFLNNTAFLQGGGSFKGGAFQANLGEVAIYNYCEFSGNRAGLDENGNQSDELGRGGAFSTRLHPRGEFYNCTFFNNEAHGPHSDGDAIMLPNEGGTFTNDLQRCVFVNTVFYGEVGNSVQVSARTGSIIQISHCAFEEGQVQTGGIVADGTILLVESPFMGSGYLFPGENSPLLDVALDTGQTVDLLGNPVPSGSGPDVGAFELQSLVAVPVYTPEMDLLSVFPNPFNPQTVLKYEVVTPGSVRLEVYDMVGHKVKTLVQDHKSAGIHSITWQGQDDHGQGLPSGVYFARLLVDGHSSISKLTLVQ